MRLLSYVLLAMLTMSTAHAQLQKRKYASYVKSDKIDATFFDVGKVINDESSRQNGALFRLGVQFSGNWLLTLGQEKAEDDEDVGVTLRKIGLGYVHQVGKELLLYGTVDSLRLDTFALTQQLTFNEVHLESPGISLGGRLFFNDFQFQLEYNYMDFDEIDVDSGFQVGIHYHYNKSSSIFIERKRIEEVDFNIIGLRFSLQK